MKIIYCKGWSRRRKYANGEFSEKKALELYQKRKPFGVVIEENDTPYCFINFNNKYIYVGFLDYLQRQYLGYEFTELEKDKIFLKEVQYWEYDENSDTKTFSDRYRFTPEGEMGIEKKNYLSKEVERLTAKNKIDTDKFYEKYPEFSDYAEIIKKEREILNSVS